MRRCLLLFVCSMLCATLFCQQKLRKEFYFIPDSVNAITYYTQMKVTLGNSTKYQIAGISANKAVIGLVHNKGQKLISFYFLDKALTDVVIGKDVFKYGSGFAFSYNWQPDVTYTLLIATASDSAAHKTLYSGYFYMPSEKKWKLIATRSYADTSTLKHTGSVQTKNLIPTFSNQWLQRSNGTWKALDSQITAPPSLRHMSNIDSLAQQQQEEEMLRSKLNKDSIIYEEGMFYQPVKTGNGRLIKVTDTLTVHYKGWIFSDGSVFDETKDKPATFPLERLIKGWQLGLVHCRIGGKMRLYLPSGSAYGIRTRAADIPPNSILVFEVEVLDAKEKR